jgi:hypothetical protein
MAHLLEQIHINFETEKIFDWSNRKKYDFYIKSLNCIIEMNGAQHYINKNFSYKNKYRTLKEEQINDNFKEQLAKDNGIKNYIIIDARYSNLDYIKNSILNCELFKLSDLSNVDWNLIDLNSLKSNLITACSLWDNDYKLVDICKELDLSIETIRRYIRKGNKIGLCHKYTPWKR